MVMAGPHAVYTEAELTVITDMWGAGKSARDIAASLEGRSWHAVRHMVIRLGLPRPERKIRDGKRGWKPRALKTAQFADAPLAMGSIGDFPGGQKCRFIAGQPSADFQCCGHPGFPFCDYHRKVCYTPNTAGRRA